MRNETLALLALLVGCTHEPTAPSPTPTQPANIESDRPADQPADQPIGGGCEYEKHPGTCTLQSESNVTFEGTIAGERVVLEANPIESTDSALSGREVGAKVPCTLDFATAGTCTPCLLSVASCGTAAWEYYRNKKP